MLGRIAHEESSERWPAIQVEQKKRHATSRLPATHLLNILTLLGDQVVVFETHRAMTDGLGVKVGQRLEAVEQTREAGLQLRSQTARKKRE